MKTELLQLSNNLKHSFAAVSGIVISFLMPIVPLILIVGAAISLDTLTGLYKSYKTNKPITSRGLSAMVSKMLLYQLALILFFCIEKFVLSDIIGILTDIPLILTKLVTTTLLFIELTSINENYKDVTGINVWQKFRELLKRAKKVSDEVKDF